MKKIPTAEEFLDLQHETVPSTGFDIRQVMIDFAKLHVEAALYVASERADLSDNGMFPYVDKESIVTAYPLENIK